MNDIPFGDNTIVSDEELIELGLHTTKKAENKVINIDDDKISELKAKAKKKEKVESDIQFNTAAQGASNSWVISGKHTESGFPLLSNDPHLANSLPSVFYIVKIYLPENTISGGVIAGLPFFAFGSSKLAAWGVTSENNDSVDICEEKIEEEFYIFKNQRIPIVKHEETIHVKGTNDIIIDIKWTKNGALLTEIPKEISPNLLGLDSNIPLSFRVSWFNYAENQIDFMFELPFTNSINEIIPKLNKNSAPLLSLIWANKKGEIAYTRTGKLPIKSPNASNLYTKNFCKGWVDEDEIKDYLSDEQTPRLINPKKGYIITANNKMVSENFISEYHGLFMFGRATRIKELIEDKIKKEEKISLQDSISFLTDVKDVYAEKAIPKILDIYERNKKKPYEDFRKHVKNLQEYQQIAQSNPNFQPPKSSYEPPQSIVLLEHLRKWNCTIETDSHVATIYALLEYNIGLNLLQPLPLDIANGVLSTKNFWNFIYSLIDKIHSGKKVELKACTFFSGSRDCEKYLVKVLDNLGSILKEDSAVSQYSGNIPFYGEIMKQVYVHKPFGVHPLLKFIFNRSIKSRGNRNTIKVSGENFNNPSGKFTSVFSPAAQFVVDLKNPTEPYINISVGNSGNIFSKFYDDRLMNTDKAELAKFLNYDFKSSLNTLKLSPL